MKIVIPILLILSLLLSAPILSAGYKQSPYWPVDNYLSNSSVLSIYYQEFLEHHDNISNANPFLAFCAILEKSEILGDRLSETAISPLEFKRLLAEIQKLARHPFGDHTYESDMRQHLLHLDYMLENIQLTVSDRFRAEFRREILSKIPPMTYFGHFQPLKSLDAIAMLME